MYQHKEAYCLMQYRAEDGTGPIEWLWNSRDGVTPFIIGSPDRKVTLQHFNFQDDIPAPMYVPNIGQRVFVDLTEAKAREYLRARVDRQWDTDGQYAMKNNWDTKEEAFEALLDGSLRDVREGGPDIVVVDAEMQERFICERETRRNQSIRHRNTMAGRRFA